MTDTLEALVAEIEAGLEGVTAGPWAAYMDDFTVRVDDRFIPAQRKIALCATGDGAGKNAAHFARLSPENVRAILEDRRSLQGEVERLRKALEFADRQTEKVEALLEPHVEWVPAGIRELVERNADYDDSAGVSTRMGDLRAVVSASEKAESTRPGAVVVKPLEWASEPPYSVARVPLLLMHYATECVWDQGRFRYCILSGSHVNQQFATLAEAKAAAQSDCERRILSAIELKPVAGAVTEALAYADDIIKRAEEELRLIRMKDCGAVYDVLLRNIGFGMWPDKLKAALQSSVGAAGEPPAQPAGEGEAVAWMASGPGWKRVFFDKEAAQKLGGDLTPLYTTPQAPVAHVEGEREAVADQIIGQIEDRFPNWRSYRDLIDCIDCTLHELRSSREEPHWRGPYKSGDEALNSLRETVAELLGEDKANWPAHRNAPLAISSAVAILMSDAQDAALASATPPPPANAGEREGWRSIPVTDETVEYVSRYGGRCRDCADNFGTCPGTNLPCAPTDAHKAIRHVLNAINYGFEHGFLPASPIPAKEG